MAHRSFRSVGGYSAAKAAVPPCLWLLPWRFVVMPLANVSLMDCLKQLRPACKALEGWPSQLDRYQAFLKHLSIQGGFVTTRSALMLVPTYFYSTALQASPFSVNLLVPSEFKGRNTVLKRGKARLVCPQSNVFTYSSCFSIADTVSYD